MVSTLERLLHLQVDERDFVWESKVVDAASRLVRPTFSADPPLDVATRKEYPEPSGGVSDFRALCEQLPESVYLLTPAGLISVPVSSLKQAAAGFIADREDLILADHSLENGLCLSEPEYGSDLCVVGRVWRGAFADLQVRKAVTLWLDGTVCPAEAWRGVALPLLQALLGGIETRFSEKTMKLMRLCYEDRPSSFEGVAEEEPVLEELRLLLQPRG